MHFGRNLCVRGWAQQIFFLPTSTKHRFIDVSVCVLICTFWCIIWRSHGICNHRLQEINWVVDLRNRVPFPSHYSAACGAPIKHTRTDAHTHKTMRRQTRQKLISKTLKCNQIVEVEESLVWVCSTGALTPGAEGWLHCHTTNPKRSSHRPLSARGQLLHTPLFCNKNGTQGRDPLLLWGMEHCGGLKYKRFNQHQ